LQRITISLDALDDAIFMAMNDVGFPVAKVLAAIEAAVAAGLAPVKINMVVKRGVNEGSILAMARYFRGSGHILRFIEYMDVGTTNGWRMSSPRLQSSRGSTPRGRSARTRRTHVHGRGRHPLAVCGRQRRDRRDRLGHAAVLPHLHARPALGRRLALHLPLREPGPYIQAGPLFHAHTARYGHVPHENDADTARADWRAHFDGKRGSAQQL